MHMDYQKEFPEFNIRNYNLAFLASEVAVDIDNYRIGRVQGYNSVNHLSKILNDLTQGDNIGENFIENDMVLAYAIAGGKENFHEYWKERRHIDNLPLHVNLVAKDLRDFKELSREKQKGLVNFCINLSQEIMNQSSKSNMEYGLVA